MREYVVFVDICARQSGQPRFTRCRRRVGTLSVRIMKGGRAVGGFGVAQSYTKVLRRSPQNQRLGCMYKNYARFCVLPVCCVA